MDEQGSDRGVYIWIWVFSKLYVTSWPVTVVLHVLTSASVIQLLLQMGVWLIVEGAAGRLKTFFQSAPGRQFIYLELYTKCSSQRLWSVSDAINYVTVYV